MLRLHWRDVISQYDYAHDALGRRTSAAKSGTMMAASENLAYGYNARSELVSAVSDTDANYNYAYAFDHIGNHIDGNRRKGEFRIPSLELLHK